MKLDIRLLGKTESGRACLMDLRVYAATHAEFMKEAHERATEGPWYYADSSEPVPETEAITVERVEPIDKPK